MRRLGIDSRHSATRGKSAVSSQSVRVSGGAGNTLNLPGSLRQQQTRTLPSHPTLRDLERDHIIKALEETKWKIGGPNSAAEDLGMARTSLINRMRKFGIPRHPS
jgi:transcriptional regulator of acetoin/glycerol metabolism